MNKTSDIKNMSNEKKSSAPVKTKQNKTEQKTIHISISFTVYQFLPSSFHACNIKMIENQVW